MRSHSFKTTWRRYCFQPYFSWFNFQLLFTHCSYILWGFLKYGSIWPNIFQNNVSCFDMVGNEKKDCKPTLSLFIYFFFYLFGLLSNFFCMQKQIFKIIFFCDHNVMSSFWVISFLIKNKSIGLTIFKLQLHNCKKLMIHKLNLPKKHCTIVKAS